MTMGAYVISESGALAWEADPQPDPTEVEHPLGATGEHADDEEVNPTGLPSRKALMAMSKEDLAAFADAHGVDPEGATKQEIVDTLYEDA